MILQVLTPLQILKSTILRDHNTLDLDTPSVEKEGVCDIAATQGGQNVRLCEMRLIEDISLSHTTAI